MYLVAGVVATVAFVLLNADETIPLVGASGAIAGVLGGYLVLYPMRPVLSLVVIAVLPIPAAIFLGLWFVTQFQFAGVEAGVAWEAHVFGFLFGVGITLLLRGPLNRRLGELHPPALPF
jgi:membrane associated rhomboid family serine protease